ncbi:hypothetical protein SAICODRAFT_224360 [Saitoella complicata NRRL Y-17804]|uniref:uncharacterized protein n=1 Tax=Saitoella complicata (strain BCRC 22490 / CBS 7301 / JCM 7358 / NBRC 10748 / NRRL Y-17804) TaxID=698492 RepID=UPI000867147B|nr:uncharacterized protein SAICODRAFT_224360 [Saitoella complicata NRRL Y-17804]ODQ53751.1 hypothetical protein SAICODRAFT_224360 [Saitoella complicata NRRL Y-17804]
MPPMKLRGAAKQSLQLRASSRTPKPPPRLEDDLRSSPPSKPPARVKRTKTVIDLEIEDPAPELVCPRTLHGQPPERMGLCSTTIARSRPRGVASGPCGQRGHQHSLPYSLHSMESCTRSFQGCTMVSTTAPPRLGSIHRGRQH